MPIFNSGSTGGIPEPQTKSNGQILSYNGTAWVAQNPAVSSVNSKTGAVSLTASDISAAATTHASRHKANGADPITPQSIGAMPIAYDSGNGTMNSTYVTSGACTWWKIGRFAFVRVNGEFTGISKTYTEYTIATGCPKAAFRSYAHTVNAKRTVRAEVSVNTAGEIILKTKHEVPLQDFHYTTIFYVTAS